MCRRDAWLHKARFLELPVTPSCRFDAGNRPGACLWSHGCHDGRRRKCCAPPPRGALESTAHWGGHPLCKQARLLYRPFTAVRMPDAAGMPASRSRDPMNRLPDTDMHPSNICTTAKAVFGAHRLRGFRQNACRPAATQKPPAIDYGTGIAPCLERRRDTERAFALPCRAEAQALLQCDCTAEQAALRLGPYCDIVVVTDGANGSCISAMGRLQARPSRFAIPTLVSNSR